MRISIIGGGPAGLYFALLMKKHNSAHQIEVLEQNPADATYGWGVVFSERALSFLKKSDAESYTDIPASPDLLCYVSFTSIAGITVSKFTLRLESLMSPHVETMICWLGRMGSIVLSGSSTPSISSPPHISYQIHTSGTARISTLKPCR